MTEHIPVTDQELTDPGPEDEDLASPSRPVEVRIDQTVYEAAKQRALSQGQALAAVAKAAMYQVAGETPEDAPLPDGRPPLREYGQPRERLRFDAPKHTYQDAQDKIRRSGRSVSQAVEDGLRRYAETGRL
jgi:hypothetical protein